MKSFIRTMMRLLICASLTLTGLLACATADKPYSYLEPKSSFISTTKDLWPVRVEFVDGSSETGRRVQVEPGTRQIRAVSLQQDGFATPRRKDLTLDIEPCKTYELAAQHSSRYNPDWELKIVKVRDEVGCQKQFAEQLQAQE
ncbi:hypothetical protein GYB61_10185 [bacterium]|nr:hypothetical protein [bacterium]